MFRAADRPWKKRVAMHKILSVEDDKLIRDELETLLVNAGFSVRSVEDLDNTLEHIREEMPDLLLLDINLPGQNGLGKVPQKKEVLAVSPSREAGKRRYSRFNLLSEETVLVLETIASGDFILNSFDNKSLRRRVCKNSEDKNLSFLCDF